MNAEPFNWNDIPLLLELARSGSMSAAGRALGSDVSTVSRRLAAVEKGLQTRLFIRGSQGYQPTDAGRVFMAHAEQAYGQVHAMLLATRSEADGIAGMVRLTAIDALFDHWLAARLPDLLQTHPLLRVKLMADNQNLSFTRREADFALRLGRPTRDAALLMRKVGEMGFAVYGGGAHTAVARRDWRKQPWLAYDDELRKTPEMQWLGRLDPSLQPALQVNSVSTLVRACEAGLGLALLPCIVAERNGLRRLGIKPEVKREVWLLSHRDTARIRRFRAVVDWLAQTFKADAAILAGD
jgi:DNA-binding transcriptional LysR family regulator